MVEKSKRKNKKLKGVMKGLKENLNQAPMIINYKKQ